MSATASGFVPDPSWPSFVELATRLWGQPNKALSTRDELRFGSNGSKSVKPHDLTFYDHEAGEGGGYIDLHLKAIGPLPPRPKPTNGHGGNVPPWENVGRCYPYHAADGTLILEVFRTLNGRPRFMQRAPDPGSRSGWRYSVRHLPNHTRLLYRLPGLLASGDATVWIAEGEKDADRLHDELLIATTNIGGAGKWRAEYAEHFRGKPAVVLQDNDQAGRDHAAMVARSLVGIAASVKVLLLPGLPEKGDVSDWLDAGGTVEELERLARDAPETTFLDVEDEPPPGELQVVPAVISKISEIPPRPWAYGRFMLFGSAAVIGAVDGAGKGTIAVGMLLAYITGSPLLREKVWRKGPVVILAYEDDQDEWRRRIAAGCIHHNLHYETIIASVHFVDKPGDRVTLAQPTANGIEFPDHARLVYFLKKIGAVALLIDPFNSAHSLEDGNSNALIVKVAQEITTIAREANVAALVLHHLRKGSTGSVDDLMGATSLRANFRSCRIILVASEGEAAGLGLPTAEAWRHLYVAGTKQNYAPPLSDRMWFRIESHDLDNPAGIYVDGDNVGAIERWDAPAAFEGLDFARLRAVFDAIAARPHARSSLAKTIPWVGKPLMEVGGRTQEQARKIITLWLQSDTLVPGEPAQSEGRHPTQTLALVPAKVAAILAPLSTQGSGEGPPDA